MFLFDSDSGGRFHSIHVDGDESTEKFEAQSTGLYWRVETNHNHYNCVTNSLKTVFKTKVTHKGSDVSDVSKSK